MDSFLVSVLEHASVVGVQVVCDLRKKLELDLGVPPALQASQSHGNHKATAG